MEATEFIWFNGSFVPWQAAQTHVISHTLHYGGGAFEGIRVYDTAIGPAVFRLKEHLDRLYYSAAAIRMVMPYSRQQLTDATLELLCRNKMRQGYIRPICFYGYGVMGVNPRNAPVESVIACWPWGAYLPVEMVDIKISSYIRIHPKSSICDAKLCGHYLNGMLACFELRDTKYHEALFLDADGNVAEGPGENIFIVKQGVIYTPQAGSILLGITRRTVMELAAALGYQVIEKSLAPREVFEADEAFFTGTAAEVTPIRSIDDRVLGNGQVGPVCAALKQAYLNLVYGRDPKYHHYLSRVPGLECVQADPHEGGTGWQS